MPHLFLSQKIESFKKSPFFQLFLEQLIFGKSRKFLLSLFKRKKPLFIYLFFFQTWAQAAAAAVAVAVVVVGVAAAVVAVFAAVDVVVVGVAAVVVAVFAAAAFVDAAILVVVDTAFVNYFFFWKLENILTNRKVQKLLTIGRHLWGGYAL